MDDDALTPTERNCLCAIMRWADQHGYLPTYRDLQVELGYSSCGSMTRIIASLESKGYLTRDNLHRIRLPGMRIILDDSPAGQRLAAIRQTCA